MPRFSNTQKDTSARTGLTRCMKKSDGWPVSSSLAQPFPMEGAMNRKIVSMVRVTAAVPMNLNSHTHAGISPEAAKTAVRRHDAAHRILPRVVK